MYANIDSIRQVKLSSVVLPLKTAISDAKVFTGRQKPMTEVVFLFAEITTESGYEESDFPIPSVQAIPPNTLMLVKLPIISSAKALMTFLACTANCCGQGLPWEVRALQPSPWLPLTSLCTT